jgi:TolB protein
MGVTGRAPCPYRSRMRGPVLLVAALLLASGCQGSATDTTTTTLDGAVTTSSVPPVERFVVATTAGEVAVYEATSTTVTRRSVSADGGHRQPVWWGTDVVVSTRSSGDGHALVARSSLDASVLWEAQMGTPPFYYLPSPAGGPWATTSLRNAPGGDGLIAELVDPSGAVEPLSTAAPFYSSWSPDGTRLALHTEGARLGIWGPDGLETIASPTGQFQAPAWTPNGIITLRATGGRQALSRWSGDAFEDLAFIDGPVRFAASPSHVAIQSAGQQDSGGVGVGLRAQEPPSLPTGRLLVLDTADGSVSTVEDTLTPMFQWDPSGTRLLYTTFDDGESLRFTWHVWEDGTVVDYASFEAQPVWFRDVVPFFDQYVQSMRLWSPTGESFAYPEAADGRSLVTIQPIDGSPQLTVEDAVWVTFPSG